MTNSNTVKPIKNNLLEFYPEEIARFWDYEKNTSGPEYYSYGSNKKVYWKDDNCGHSWQASIYNFIVKGNRCPYARGLKIDKTNSLEALCPVLSKEFSLELNALKPSEVSFGSSRKVFWHCPLNHTWLASVKMRTTRNQGCPTCANKILLHGFNDLFTKTPLLKEYWDYSENTVSPEAVIFNTSTSFYLKCPKCSYSWAGIMRNYFNKNEYGICPKCSSRSRLEQMFFTFLSKSYKGKIVKNARPFYSYPCENWELDFYLPELSLAFEVQDFATHAKISDEEKLEKIWHARAVRRGHSLYKKGPAYHEQKRNDAKKYLAVALYDIWEDEIVSGVCDEKVKRILKAAVEAKKQI